LILGLVVGLAYAWLINPVIYGDSTPATLAAEDKDHYRSMIAQVYALSGDFQRASIRLELLEDLHPVYALGGQAQQALAAGFEHEARALALLASTLQNSITQKKAPTNLSPISTEPPPGVPTQTLPVPTATP